MMMQSSEPRSVLPYGLLVALVAGSLLALAGGYWDDAWHTERGRDDFFIAPHIAIYGGVAIAGGALALWVAQTAKQHGPQRVLHDPPLILALVSVLLTLASAPIDNAWHVAFGRDAVIWSAPHVLGIIGTAGLAGAVLIEITESPGPMARRMAPVAGALLLTALAFLVVEYETDVPQFDAVWYLPALATASALGLGLVRLLAPGDWPATTAAVLHLMLIAAVALFLLGIGFDAPQLPLLVAPAVVLDLAWRRRLPVAIEAALYVAALYGIYVPVFDFLGRGVYLDVADVLIGAPMALAGVTLVLTATRPPAAHIGRSASAAVAAGVLLAALGTASSALAHDPGQGPDAGSAKLDVRVHSRTIGLDAQLWRADCARFRRAAMVARRGGETVRAPLRTLRPCRYSGELQVDQRGRWFVYAEFRAGDETIESWLPVKTDDDSARFRALHRYAYVAEDRGTTLWQGLAAAALYAVILAFGAGIVVLARRAVRSRPESASSTSTP